MENYKTNPDDQAFPNDATHNWHGLTKLEYFAGLALQGILANKNYVPNGKSCKVAVELANLLIKNLNKE